MSIVSDAEKGRVLEIVAAHLGRLQGLAKSLDETFIALSLASAQRQVVVRCEELVTGGDETADRDNTMPLGDSV